MSFLDDLGDLMTGGKVADLIKLPYHPPLEKIKSVSNQKRIFAVQERPFSFTGEDFDVVDVSNRGAPFCKVRGAMLHLPGKDKMRIFSSSGSPAAVLDRKLVALTPTYDIYRSDSAVKFGWIEKKVVSLTDTFDVFLEGQGGSFGPVFKPPPAFCIEGDFVNRNFVFKNAKNQVAAKVSKDWLIEFDEFNHYQVQVAAGMDAMLVIACLCVIDEEFDQEHREAKKREEGGEKGGWF
jgi:uncharacterized protein YxjI